MASLLSIAERHVAEAKARYPKRETCREARLLATMTLAEEISTRLNNERTQPTGDVFDDLLSAALDRIAFIQIAERLVADFFN